MLSPLFSTLGSIDAVRPVFLIIMGMSLMVFVWRLAGRADDWAARLMVAGSILLGFGYAILLPGYEAGLIPKMARAFEFSSGSAIGWQVVKLFVMNGGWLSFGIGIAMHAKVLPCPAPKKVAVPVKKHQSQPAAAHESAA